jgi:hypothetical protein
MRRRTLLGLSVALLSGCRKAQREGERKAPPPPRTRFLFGGDVMLSRYIGRVSRSKKDAAWPFRAIAGQFAAADIAFVNLETPFSEKARVATKG